MPQMTMSLDISKAVEALTDLEKTQLPYAVARVLTESAAGARNAVQKVLAPGSTSPFTIRNAWTSQSIRLVPASKGTLPLQAKITADAGNGKAPDYLALQDAGGEKVPHKGHQHIAVPSAKLIQMVGRGNIIPAELRPSALLEASRNGGRYTRIKRRGRMKGQIALTDQKIVRGFVFFTQKANGVDTIMGRYITDRSAYVFYWLVPETHVKPVLRFEQICEATVKANWAAIWQRVWQDIRIKGIKL